VGDWAPALEEMLFELFADCATLEITWADLDMAVWIASAVVAANSPPVAQLGFEFIVVSS